MPKLTTYRTKIYLGYISHMATEWWTDEDWKEWREYVEELKRTEEFGKEVEIEMTVVHNPVLDEGFEAPPTSSFKMEMLDLSIV